MPLMRSPERGSTYVVIDQHQATSAFAGACR